jgi:hypothetical protein
MAAVLPLAPPQIRNRRVFIENPRTFAISISRQQFRELPFTVVLLGVLSNAPRLVFSERDAPQADVWQAEIDWRVLPYMRAREREWWSRVREIRTRVMRYHLDRVALAIGYTWPGNPPGHIEFADG